MIATHLDGTERPEGLRSKAPTVLVMGNEQSGISGILAAACDTLVRIPMRAGSDSLNLAAATAIMVHALWLGEDTAQ